MKAIRLLVPIVLALAAIGFFSLMQRNVETLQSSPPPLTHR